MKKYIAQSRYVFISLPPPRYKPNKESPIRQFRTIRHPEEGEASAEGVATKNRCHISAQRDSRKGNCRTLPGLPYRHQAIRLDDAISFLFLRLRC